MSKVSENIKNAQILFGSSLTCDLLYGPGPAGPVPDMPIFEDAGFKAVSLTVAIDDDAWPSTIVKKLSDWRFTLSRQPDRYRLIHSVEDLRSICESKKLGIMFHFQGTEAVGRSLPMVGTYAALGVKWMLIAYNRQNNAGTGCLEAQKQDSGLTEFGRELVAEMNRVGMIVDCSHTGYRTTMDTMAASEKPVIFSHSNAYALFAHPRNIKDDQIKACAETGGLIGVNGVGSFVGDIKEVRTETVFAHLDYMVQMVGPDHVALGLDYMTPALCEMALNLFGGDLSRVGMSEPPWSFFEPQRAVGLVAMMLDHGYPEASIRSILGQNFVRVAEATWKA